MGCDIESMSDYAKQVSKFPVLSKEEIGDISLLAQQGDKAALEKAIMSNQRLVIKLAYQYMPYTQLEGMDLVMEGNIGLQKAVLGYDPTRGFTFSTYAVRWIRKYMQAAVQKNSSPIQLPAWMAQKIYSFKTYVNTYRIEKDDESAFPTRAEIKKEMEIKDSQIDNLLSAYFSTNVVYLDKTIAPDGAEDTEDTLSIFLYDKDPKSNPEAQAAAYAFGEVFETLLNKSVFHYRIPSKNIERYKDIIRRRFLPKEGRDFETLEELGKEYGITRERARQLEAMFIKFCRLPENKKLLRDFL